MSQKKPSIALSKTTTLSCSSVSIAVMISLSCGIVSGPKMLRGGMIKRHAPIRGRLFS